MSATRSTERRKVPLLLWPFWAVWRLVETILKLTGRIVALVLGLVLMLVGVILSLTIVGAVIGVPLFVVGILMVIRALF